LVTENDADPKEALRAAVAGFAPSARFGVAVSGGGDSVALLVLAADVLGPGRVCAASVDHGLRPAAGDEARAVGDLCRGLGVAHETLHWDGAAAQGNLMDAARRARLALLAGWAGPRGLAAVLLGHTLDDQAETVLLRLARGSGVDGLAGMAAARRSHGVLWLRPFLGVTRAALRAELVARGTGWAEDPTNVDARFARSRARLALAALQPLGITARGLVATAGRMARARAALERQAGAELARLARDDRGTVQLDRAVLDLPGECRDRLFAGLIRGLTSAPYRPRLASLQQAVARMAVPGGAATLAGVCLRNEGQAIRLWREAAAVSALRCPANALWDGRWRARGPGGDDVLIGALGPAGLIQLGRQARAGLHPHWRETGLARAVLAGLPAIWRGASLVAAPLAGWPQNWSLTARPVAASDGDMGEFD